MEKEYINKRIETILSRSEIMSNGCREWKGATMRFGYGMIRFGKRNIAAHRLHYILANNLSELASNIYVCHTCDNPACVLLAHLFLGTPKDNRQDCLNKGRHCKHPRKYNFVRIHSDETVREIKQDIRDAVLTGRQIANKYNVSAAYISKLKNGRLKSLII